MTFKIELLEHDGFIHQDGSPRLVTVKVTFEDGRVVRFPYPAQNEISSLYGAAERAAGLAREEKAVLPTPQTPLPAVPMTVVAGKPEPVKDGEIQRRDTVKFIGKTDKDSPAELVTGREYRVIAIEKLNGETVAVGIIDDASPNKIRLDVQPADLVLVQKAPPKPAKLQGAPEIIRKCTCKEDVVLTLNGENYIGDCDGCLQSITIPKGQA